MLRQVLKSDNLNAWRKNYIQTQSTNADLFNNDNYAKLRFLKFCHNTEPK